MRGCEVDGCRNPHEARGYCATHYSRWQRHGDATVPPKVHRSTLTLDELVEEIDWLRGGGVSPELICVSLGARRESLHRRLVRAGLRELASMFEVQRVA